MKETVKTMYIVECYRFDDKPELAMFDNVNDANGYAEKCMERDYYNKVAVVKETCSRRTLAEHEARPIDN